MPVLKSTYTAPKFFKSAFAQTLYSVYLRQVPRIFYKREKVITPDRDFLYLDWLLNDPRRLVILSHGIVGDSQTTYTRGMAKVFAEQNWSVLAWNMRGRGGLTTNWHQKNYHLGYTDDLRFVVNHAIQKNYKEVILIGFSMGANIVLKYLGEESKNLNETIKASVAFSAPIDIVSCGEQIDHPSRRLYSNRLLREVMENTISRISMITPMVDIERLLKVKTWREFDEIYTAPLYGFDSVLDYRKKASSKPLLSQISIPSLLINAKDDPLLSQECFPEDASVQNHPYLFGEFPENGGHLGFVCFDKSGLIWSEQRSLEFVKSIL